MINKIENIRDKYASVSTEEEKDNLSRDLQAFHQEYGIVIFPDLITMPEHEFLSVKNNDLIHEYIHMEGLV